MFFSCGASCEINHTCNYSDRLELQSLGIWLFWVGKWVTRRSLCLLMKAHTPLLFRKERRWGRMRGQFATPSRTMKLESLFSQLTMPQARRKGFCIDTRPRTSPLESLNYTINLSIYYVLSKFCITSGIIKIHCYIFYLLNYSFRLGN